MKRKEKFSARTCSYCKDAIAEENFDKFECYYAQSADKSFEFCSVKCMKSWLNGQMMGMIAAMTIGLIIFFGMMFGGGQEQFLAPFLLFIPYMIRRLIKCSFGLMDGGLSLINFVIVFLGSITIIVPLIILIREILFFIRTFKKISLLESEN